MVLSLLCKVEEGQGDRVQCFLLESLLLSRVKEERFMPPCRVKIQNKSSVVYTSNVLQWRLQADEIRNVDD